MGTYQSDKKTETRINIGLRPDQGVKVRAKRKRGNKANSQQGDGISTGGRFKRRGDTQHLTAAKPAASAR